VRGGWRNARPFEVGTGELENFLDRIALAALEAADQGGHATALVARNPVEQVLDRDFHRVQEPQIDAKVLPRNFPRLIQVECATGRRPSGAGGD
jgi:hypothetical protein